MNKNEVKDTLETIIKSSLLIQKALEDVIAALDEKPQAEPAKTYTLEDVRAALTKLAGAKGADAAKAVLAKHDAKKLSDIFPPDYAVVVADAEAAL
jgi:flagellar hook-length control protein FliK